MSTRRRSAIPAMVELSRSLASMVLEPGDLAIDATVGNGHDTIWLANRVGPGGRVVGLDLQQEALTETSRRLREARLDQRVILAKLGHERLDAVRVEGGRRRRPRVVMFNLGYRPGGDHAIVTRPATTLRALAIAIEWVLPGGLVNVVMYPGHSTGRDEADRVLSWAATLDPRSFALLKCESLLTRSPAPTFLAIAPVDPGPAREVIGARRDEAPGHPDGPDR